MAEERAPGPTRRRVLGGLASLGAVGLGGGMMVDQARGLRSSSRPALISHRGAAGLEPANTLVGIREALEYDVDAIELDVRRASDGTLVLFHDPILDWATDGHGRVEDTPWSELSETRIDGEPIPKLEGALAVLADEAVGLHLEAKKVGYTRSILDRVEEFGLTDRLTLASPKPEALVPAREAGLPTRLVGIAPNPELLQTASTIGATSVSSHYVPSAFPWFLEQAHEHGLGAGLWNLMETQESLEAVTGVDPDFLTTNRPDLAVQLYEE